MLQASEQLHLHIDIKLYKLSCRKQRDLYTGKKLDKLSNRKLYDINTYTKPCKPIGVGRFRIFGEPRFRILGGGGGGARGANSQQAHDVVTNLQLLLLYPSTWYICD